MYGWNRANGWERGCGWPDGEPLGGNRRSKSRNLRLQKWKARPQCHYCGCLLAWEETTLDHVVPHSKGGPTTAENTVLACGPCNTKKANRMPG